MFIKAFYRDGLDCFLDILEEKDTTISAGGEQPRLGRMEADVEDSQLVPDGMTAKNLDGNNQRISHQIRVHHAVKDMNGPIIGSTGHQRVSTMVLD
jgi:hypothetical protein